MHFHIPSSHKGVISLSLSCPRFLWLSRFRHLNNIFNGKGNKNQLRNINYLWFLIGMTWSDFLLLTCYWKPIRKMACQSITTWSTSSHSRFSSSRNTFHRTTVPFQFLPAVFLPGSWHFCMDVGIKTEDKSTSHDCTYLHRSMIDLTWRNVKKTPSFLLPNLLFEVWSGRNLHFVLCCLTQTCPSFPPSKSWLNTYKYWIYSVR